MEMEMSPVTIKTRRACEEKELKKQTQKSGGKDSVINSCSSSPLMRHTSINGVHLPGKSTRSGTLLPYGPGLALAQNTYIIKSLISGGINNIIRFTEPLSLPQQTGELQYNYMATMT